MSNLFPEADHDVVGRHGQVMVEVLPHDFNPSISDEEARELLLERIDIEGRVEYDRIVLGELKEEHPEYAEALQDWLKHEKENLIRSGVVIDDVMLAEAEILDEIIAEVDADQEDPELIKLAEVMKDLRVARHNLKDFQSRHQLAA